MPRDKSRAALLAEFTDKVNQFGPESSEVREFRLKHESDGELAKLFRTVVKVQSQFRQGQLPTRENEAEVRKPSAIGRAVVAKH